MYTKNLDDMILRYRVTDWNSKLWVIFCPTPKNPKQNFEKLKKIAEDITILHVYTKNQNHRWYKSWIQSETENQNFEKMKKTPRDTIILHECTKDHDHMLHSSWDMARGRCNFNFFILGYFYPFTPLTTQKIKIKKKEKNPFRYHHFTWCMIPAIYEIQQTKFFVILNNFLPFYLLTTQKIKILKKRKNLDRLSFYTCVPQMTII